MAQSWMENSSYRDQRHEDDERHAPNHTPRKAQPREIMVRIIRIENGTPYHKDVLAREMMQLEYDEEAEIFSVAQDIEDTNYFEGFVYTVFMRRRA